MKNSKKDGLWPGQCVRDEMLITSISLSTSASSRPWKLLFRFGLMMTPIIKVQNKGKSEIDLPSASWRHTPSAGTWAWTQPGAAPIATIPVRRWFYSVIVFLANLLLWPGLGVRFGLLALPGLWPPPCTWPSNKHHHPPCTWVSNQHHHSYQQDQEDQPV